MWLSTLITSISIFILMLVLGIVINKSNWQVKRRLNFFNLSFAGVIIAAIVMFYPVHNKPTSDSRRTRTATKELPVSDWFWDSLQST